MKNGILTAGLVVALFAVAASMMAHPQIYSVTPQQGGKGATGSSGSSGTAATIAAGTISSLPTGSAPTISNSGSSAAAVFNFAIPVGLTGSSGSNGSNGSAATIAVGSTSTLAAGASATVANSGSSSAATFNFGIPQGAVGATGAAGVNAISAPNARTVAFATAYQATDTTKPAFVQVAISCTASVALGSPQTNTVELRIGPTNSVASGGGSQVDVFSSSLSVSVILTIGWTGQQMLKASLPIGYYFAPRILAGTGCTISAASDQSIG